VILEPLQRQADGRLLQIEPAGGRADAAGAGDLAEDLEQVEIDAPEQRRVDHVVLALHSLGFHALLLRGPLSLDS